MIKRGLVFLICTMLIVSFSITRAEARNYNEVGDVRYFVGMMYHDAWIHSDGKTWQNNKDPFGGSLVAVHQNYVFNNIEGRKIKNVSVSAYKGTPEEHIIKSRGEVWEKYKDRSSTNVSPAVSNLQGIGGREVSFTVTVNANLNADEPLEITDEATQAIHENVEGYRTFLPILIKVELEAESNAPKTSLMSTFNNYTINRQAPKNLHTFWMYYNSDSTD
ncbi:hypothetical protein, partial [Alkaliphilus transvaalensis]|uniref:hypothetical protein n=1 Tax=Alkaliphilus transvaalensis TaxID=114628 RepID=UPI000478B076